jgi:colanic acid/amylovoran biosynthesis glycosyltransferase
VAVQRCPQFVGRTTNWLYDHLREVPGYEIAVLCDELVNRSEFPALAARALRRDGVLPKLWRRLCGDRLFPTDNLWLRRLKPHVLHSHFGVTGLEDLRFAPSLGIPWLVSFYGADVYQNVTESREYDRYELLFQRVARVLALGPQMGRMLESLGCPGEKVVIHPLGVGIASLPFAPRKLKDGRMKVLFAGTFREKKGLEYAIEGVNLARQRGVDIHLFIVGDEMGKPGDRETKEGAWRLIRRHGLEVHVTHHPFLPFHKLVDLAMDCHVFLAPSVTAADGDSEGTPFVLQQMMVTGMAAISTIHSDIPYLFGPHSHLLVPERDAAAIADRLARFADEPEQVTREGQMLRDRMCDAFDARQCAARLAQVYQTLDNKC